MSSVNHFLKSCYVRKNKLIGTFIRLSGSPGTIVPSSAAIHNHCPVTYHWSDLRTFTPCCSFLYDDPNLLKKIEKLEEGTVFRVCDNTQNPISGNHIHHAGSWPLYTEWAVDEDLLELR